MASGIIYGTTENTYIECALAWEATGDAANNWSDVWVTLRLKKSSQSTSSTSGSGYFNLQVDGAGSNAVNIGSISIPRDDTWHDYYSWHFTNVGHGADGSRSMPMALLNDTPSTSYSGLPGTSYTASYISGTAVFDTLVLAPAAPSAVTPARVSDTQHNVGWTRNAATRAPYAAQVVMRADNVNGITNFYDIATVSGDASSYSDTTTQANREYRYKVRAVNSAGSATSAESASVYTTPSAPSSCSAIKTGASTVTVTCTDNANTETAFEWQRTTDGGANWSTLGTTGANVTTYADTNLPGGTVAYRVRATRGTMLSEWSAASNSVTTTTPPAAPTITNQWGAYSPTGTTLRISWQHNTLDGSAQSKAEIAYNFGGSDTVYTLNGAGTYYDIPISGKAANTVVNAKVRTYGLSATPGPYSSVQSTRLAGTPQANITTPATNATVITDLPLAVGWSYTDAFAQAGWTLALAKDGVTVAVWTGTTQTSQQITSAHLKDDSSYMLTLTVRSGSGFTASASRSFTTDFLVPTVPTISATFDPAALTATIIGAAGPTGALPPTNHLVLVRIDSFDGLTTSTEIVNPFVSGGAFVDRTPRLGQTVTYRLLAVAGNGAYSYTDTTVKCEGSGRYGVNFGIGGTSLLVMRWNRKASASISDDSEAITFAGRALPVVYAGEHTQERISLSATLTSDDDLVRVRELGQWRQAVTYRDPRGYRCRAKVTGISHAPEAIRGHHSVSLDLMVVE